MFAGSSLVPSYGRADKGKGLKSEDKKFQTGQVRLLYNLASDH